MTESTAGSTAPIPLPLWERPEKRLFLVGSQLAFQRYCHDRGLNPRSDRIRRVAEAYQLRGHGRDTATVIFLAGYQDALPRQWREIHEICLVLGLADPPELPREEP